ADGTRLHGWFIPAATGAADAATILHVHGNAGSINDHLGFTDYVPGSGFNLFIFDYRGYGQSEGRARRREPLIADAAAALDAVLARPDVDAARIGMYAQSLGGGIGLNVMADRPEIAAAVVESGFASWRDIAAEALGGDTPGPISRLVARMLIRDTVRPVDAIARIDRPVLLVHGTDDTIVPVGHSRRLAAAGPTAALVELDRGGHNTLRETHPELERIVVDFYLRTLPPRR
ncbi:MAG: alpha/beta hydrolase, partial [Planctomycetota bacterium]